MARTRNRGIRAPIMLAPAPVMFASVKRPVMTGYMASATASSITTRIQDFAESSCAIRYDVENSYINEL